MIFYKHLLMRPTSLMLLNYINFFWFNFFWFFSPQSYASNKLFSALEWKQKNHEKAAFYLSLETPPRTNQKTWFINGRPLSDSSLLIYSEEWSLLFPFQIRNNAHNCQIGQYAFYFSHQKLSSPKKEMGCMEDLRFKKLYNAFNKLQTQY